MTDIYYQTKEIFVNKKLNHTLRQSFNTDGKSDWEGIVVSNLVAMRRWLEVDASTKSFGNGIKYNSVHVKDELHQWCPECISFVLKEAAKVNSGFKTLLNELKGNKKDKAQKFKLSL